MKKRIPNPNKMKRINGPKLSAEQLRSAKVRITMFVDEDLLVALRKMAEEVGSRYQTLMNQLLRNAVLAKGGGILERLEKLEKAVFNDKAA